MERERALRKKRRRGESFEVGRAREDAVGFLAPGFDVAAFAVFRLDLGERLQKELAVVGKSEGILASDAAGDLVNKEFTESDVDGGSRLEVADGGENVRSDDVAIGNATHLAAQVVVAE
jgi:hypothetical protein